MQELKQILENHSLANITISSTPTSTTLIDNSILTDKECRKFKAFNVVHNVKLIASIVFVTPS